MVRRQRDCHCSCRRERCGQWQSVAAAVLLGVGAVSVRIPVPVISTLQDRPRKRTSTRVAALLALSFGSEHAIRSQETTIPGESCARMTTDDIRRADEIVLLPAAAGATPVIERAVEHWQRCEGYATAFPRFVVGEGRGRRVKVRIENRLVGQGHCGFFVGETITVYRRSRLDERILSCWPLERVLAHELGHVLGLRDAEAPRGCLTSIMSAIVGSRPALQKVATAECGAADRKWMTSEEEAREASPAKQ